MVGADPRGVPGSADGEGLTAGGDRSIAAAGPVACDGRADGPAMAGEALDRGDPRKVADAPDDGDGATLRTPAAWRAIALGVLVGGFAAGYRATAGRRATAPLAGAAAILVGFVLPVARATRRPPIPPSAPALDPAAPPVTFSVVIAGRDEATVLPRLVADIAAQDWRDADGTPRFELLVIDDRSTDGTGAAVMAAASAAGIAHVTRVIRREGDHLPDGKGAALTAAQPGTCRGEVVTVLDADARIAPGYLRTLAGYVAAGAPAVTPRRRTLDAGSSLLAQLQADEQDVDGELQRGRWAMGGCSEFRGNGITIRRDLLAAVGGWQAHALTEDIDLASRIAAAHGVTVALALDAEVWEEPVRTWRGLLRQRLRWAEGGLRRNLEHGQAVLTSPYLDATRKRDFAIYGGQLLAPPLILGAIAGAVRRSPAGAVILVGTYMAMAGGLAWDALRWEPDAQGNPPPPRERLVRSVRQGLFSAFWLAAIPGAMWRLATRSGRVRYDKMPHHGSGDDPA